MENDKTCALCSHKRLMHTHIIQQRKFDIDHVENTCRGKVALLLPTYPKTTVLWMDSTLFSGLAAIANKI